MLFPISVCSVVLIALAASSLAQIDCTDKPDGIYGTGCRSYTKCSGGSGTIVDCDPGYVLDYEVGECRLQELVPPPCGTDDDCSTLHDGKYPVMPECRYFFTCKNGSNLGSSPCNDPPTSGDLVFDVDQQLCNWRWDVLEPCGTYAPYKSSL